jgi:hypothetical protein
VGVLRALSLLSAPEDDEARAVAGRGDADARQSEQKAGVRGNTQEPLPDNDALPPGWEKADAGGGKVYYANRQTGESSWGRPTISTELRPGAASKKKPAAAGGSAGRPSSKPVTPVKTKAPSPGAAAKRPAAHKSGASGGRSATAKSFKAAAPKSAKPLGVQVKIDSTQPMGIRFEGETLTVKLVAPGSQADTARISPGDRITSANGDPVESSADIVKVLTQAQKTGEPILITVASPTEEEIATRRALEKATADGRTAETSAPAHTNDLISSATPKIVSASRRPSSGSDRNFGTLHPHPSSATLMRQPSSNLPTPTGDAPPDVTTRV